MKPIKIQTIVACPIEQAWNYYFEPQHIVNWNQASKDWHCPHAESDLKAGGRFSYRMAARDGSAAFDFRGAFTQVELLRLVSYVLDDGRAVEVQWRAINEKETELTVYFEPETMHPEEFQQMGWQAILDSFQGYAEQAYALVDEHPLIPSLWMSESEAEELFDFYVELFKTHFPHNTKILHKTAMTVEARLAGMRFLGVKGRPGNIKPSPSVSFMVVCDSKEVVDALYEGLLQGGNIYMELGAYPWSERYAWVGDRFGYTWQLYFGNLQDTRGQAIIPTLLFTQEQDGRCGEALAFYESLFPGFLRDGIMFHDDPNLSGKIAHAQFVAHQTLMAAMDGGPAHQFGFSEAISFTIPCRNQEEIDYYWARLTEKGEESWCGWCKDQFGVFWQVVPANVKSLMFDCPRPDLAFQAMRQMRKLDLNTLKKAGMSE